MKKEEAKQLLYESFNKPKPESKKKPTIQKSKVLFITAFISLIAVGVLIANLMGSSDTVVGPWGKIITPKPGTSTREEVQVTVETRNLSQGQYVWLAVDKPALGLCWPKAPRIEPNFLLRTAIFEGGPNEQYTLSLYLVDEYTNEQWQEWLDRKIFGGLPMLPNSRRLDSTILIKKL